MTETRKKTKYFLFPLSIVTETTDTRYIWHSIWCTRKVMVSGQYSKCIKFGASRLIYLGWRIHTYIALYCRNSPLTVTHCLLTINTRNFLKKECFKPKNCIVTETHLQHNKRVYKYSRRVQTLMWSVINHSLVFWPKLIDNVH